MKVVTSERACVLVRCDVGATLGVGHLMRSLALGEEFLARGAQVTFCADVGSVPWAAEQLTRRGIDWVPAVSSAEEHVELAREHGARLMVVDSYLLRSEVYSALRKEGTPLLAVVDGEIDGREADVYLDQNLDAEKSDPRLPPGAIRLAGLEYALMRNEILDARGRRPGPPPDTGPVRVFAFFGGTDAFGAGPDISRSLVATGLPFSATVVAGNDQLGAAISETALRDGQRLQVIPPTARLVEHVTGADLVLSAAGTSTWELLCLGSATGLVCVAENQLLGYERMVATGAAVGLGTLQEVRKRPEATVEALTALLEDGALRSRLRALGRRLVDGQGRRRVVDATSRHLGLSWPT